MSEKIRTIKKLKFTAKWVEFWFEEEVNIVYDTYYKKDVDRWTQCCKSYMLQELVDKYGLSSYIFYNGWNSLIGEKIKFKDKIPVEFITLKIVKPSKILDHD